MTRSTLAWLGPLVLATLILGGSLFFRLTSDGVQPAAPADAAAAAVEEAEPVGARRDHVAPASDDPALPKRLPAIDDLSEWSRTSDTDQPAWRLRWESDAARAARVLTYLSSHSRVVDFSLTAGTGDQWIIEASMRDGPEDPRTDENGGGAHGRNDRTEEEVEAELARLLHGNTVSREPAGADTATGSAQPSPGPVRDILNGGTGSVRFRQGDTYRWVRRRDVLSLELSP
ncbi:MAG: hypothetical protein ACOCYB_10805 [Alkalispirochaeta sp.]